GSVRANHRTHPAQRSDRVVVGWIEIPFARHQDFGDKPKHQGRAGESGDDCDSQSEPDPDRGVAGDNKARPAKTGQEGGARAEIKEGHIRAVRAVLSTRVAMSTPEMQSRPAAVMREMDMRAAKQKRDSAQDKSNQK